jgi:predicted PurR-regulated permease PerM
VAFDRWNNFQSLHPTILTESSSSAERKVAWAILLLLLGGCLVVLLPFVPALLWALVLCVTLWPFYQRLLRLFRQRHTPLRS